MAAGAAAAEPKKMPAEALAVALTKNSSLLKLNIRFNSISNTGLTHLLTAMGQNTTLDTLLLWGNCFYPTSIAPNKSSTSSQILLNIQGRWKEMAVFSDVKPYVVDDVIQIAELEVPPAQFAKDI